MWPQGASGRLGRILLGTVKTLPLWPSFVVASDTLGSPAPRLGILLPKLGIARLRATMSYASVRALFL